MKQFKIEFTGWILCQRCRVLLLKLFSLLLFEITLNFLKNTLKIIFKLEVKQEGKYCFKPKCWSRALYTAQHSSDACHSFILFWLCLQYFVCFLRKSLQLEGKLRQYVQWCADNCKNTKVSCRQYPPSTVEIAVRNGALSEVNFQHLLFIISQDI